MSTLLEAVRVVELSEALAGPYCAMMLGDLGAEVIKVERPGTGDQSRTWGPPFIGTESAYFLAVNRNKRSITLDYDHPAGAEALGRLLARADVFICNQRSWASLEKRGLDPTTLRAKHPRLIYCAISGYGLFGARAGQPGYDILAQAEAGVMSFTGDPGTAPMRFPVAIADITTGIYGAAGTLAALYARERTGQGDFLDMALFDSQLTWLANIGSNFLNAGVSPARCGNSHPSIVPYQLFHGSDGRAFVLAVGTQAVWQRLSERINLGEGLGGDPRFRSNAERIQHRDPLVRLLEQRFASLPAATWVERLMAADIPAALVQTVGEALNNPQTVSRSLIVEIEHPTLKAVRSIASPMRFAAHPILYRLPPPLLGEHSATILRELGFSEEEIAETLASASRAGGSIS